MSELFQPAVAAIAWGITSPSTLVHDPQFQTRGALMCHGSKELNARMGGCVDHMMRCTSLRLPHSLILDAAANGMPAVFRSIRYLGSAFPEAPERPRSP